jgi:IS5 family transposase
MRPKERRDSGQNDMFRASLDQIVDTIHMLEKLARTIDGGLSNERSARFTRMSSAGRCC